MKIAVLSDIHGNDYALRKVLKEIDILGVEKLLLLGDYVGYYYNVDIVLNLIKKYDKIMIKGNHELLMKQSIDDADKASQISEKYGYGIEYAKKVLSTKQINYLIGLPEKDKLDIAGVKISICHGSPWDIYEYIYPDTSEDIKKRCFDSYADFVFIGHSHYSFIYKYGKNVLVNVGSVGQNRSVGGIANWCLLDTVENKCVIKETYYDTKPLIEQIKNINPSHGYLVDVLGREI